MIILRYLILASILWTFPSFILGYFSPVWSSLLSHLTFLMLVLHFGLVKDKSSFLWPFILMGLTYYVIAGLIHVRLPALDYIILIMKYLIIVICGAEILRKTSINELYVFLIIGGISIILNAIVFPRYNTSFSLNYGRFSGFYLNPNLAGAMCLIGLALSVGIKNEKFKYFGFLIFAAAGFFTFSRYFLAMFLLINAIMVFINKRFITAPILGVICMILIYAFSSSLNLNAERFNALVDVFSDTHREEGVKVLEEDSRTETWAVYKDVILDKPILGNGYGILQGNNNLGFNIGVHNTYLMVIGEAGILPFFILLGIYIYLLTAGFKTFKSAPMNFVLAIVLSTALLVSHTYFDSFSLLLMSMYLYIILTENQSAININKEEDLEIYHETYA